MMKLAHIWYIDSTAQPRWGGYAAPETTNVMAVTLALTLFSLSSENTEEEEKKWTVTAEWQFFFWLKRIFIVRLKLFQLAPFATPPSGYYAIWICTYLNPITFTYDSNFLSLTFHPFCCYTRINDGDDEKKCVSNLRIVENVLQSNFELFRGSERERAREKWIISLTSVNVLFMPHWKIDKRNLF